MANESERDSDVMKLDTKPADNYRIIVVNFYVPDNLVAFGVVPASKRQLFYVAGVGECVLQTGDLVDTCTCIHDFNVSCTKEKQ